MFSRHWKLAVLIAIAIVLFVWFESPEWVVTAHREPPEILNNTLGFQHIFAINLPSRTDRRDALTLAAALSELDITWVDGVAGKDVLEKVLPGNRDSRKGGFTVGNKGSWRAHMNVLQHIIQHNISSALILEDDADWDLRLKSQMHTFAKAAVAFTQPSPDQTLAEQYRSYHGPEFPITQFPQPLPRPRLTPYGDEWDVLWLGHCGTDFPPAPPPDSSTSTRPPPLRVTIPNDATVPPPQHLKPHPFALQDAVATEYPPYTRVVHASSHTACSQAYAVTQRGARLLLWQFGLQTLTAGWDLMLRDWCDGLYTAESDIAAFAANEGKRRVRRPVCVTVQPPLFSHHYGKGAASDIMAPGGGFVGEDMEVTPYLRVSVRLNMGRLVNGLGVGDQWAGKGGAGDGGGGGEGS